MAGNNMYVCKVKGSFEHWILFSVIKLMWSADIQTKSHPIGMFGLKNVREI